MRGGVIQNIKRLTEYPDIFIGLTLQGPGRGGGQGDPEEGLTKIMIKVPREPEADRKYFYYQVNSDS